MNFGVLRNILDEKGFFTEQIGEILEEKMKMEEQTYVYYATNRKSKEDRSL